LRRRLADDAFGEIGRAFSRIEGNRAATVVRFNFAASGVLLQQIMQGAPADVFASAAVKEMDVLNAAGRIEPATRIVFARNQLVLIVPQNSALGRASTKPWGWYSLADPGVRRVALSNPESVPSGRYARQLLERQGVWPRVQNKAIFGENVRQTLTYVATGDADAGIVFATDARHESRRVRVLARSVPGRDHEPIVYPAAVVRDAPNAAAARRFVRFLRSGVAQAILRRHGFLPPDVPIALPPRRR
jgi:molybdate transport system substrate-binding protein